MPVHPAQRPREAIVEGTVRLETFAVGRIRDDEARRLERFQAACVARFDDELDSGRPRILARPDEGRRVGVARVDGRAARQRGGPRLVSQGAHPCAHGIPVAGPSLEAEPLARQPGREPSRPCRRLDGDRAGSTHGIEQRALPVPARQPEDCGRERLAQGGLTGLRAPAALVEGCAPHVEVERRPVARQVDGEAHVRILAVDRGAGPEGGAEGVDDCVFRLLRDELRVRQPARAARRANGEGRPGRHPFGPVDRARAFVESLLVGRVEGRDLEQDANRNPCPEASARRIRELALEVNSAAIGTDVPKPELAELIPERGLGSLGGRGEEAQTLVSFLTYGWHARMRKAQLIESRALSPAVRSLTFRTVDRRPVGHVAGQYVDLVVPTPRGLPFRRAYSIASAPDPRSPDVFEVAVTRVEGGPTSEALHGLAPGAQVEVEGPQGTFVRRDEERSHPALFVAAGTGLAPIRAMLAESLREDLRTEHAPSVPPLRLLFGCRTPRDILWGDELRGWELAGSPFRLCVTLSRPPPDWTGLSGYVQRHVCGIAASLPDVRVYVCGLSAMVEEVVKVLERDAGLPREALRYETYD